MRFNKIPRLFVLLLCFCVVLLSGCGIANSPGASALANGHTATVHPTSSAQSVSSTNCPATGTTRASYLPAETGTGQPAVFYLTEWGGTQSGIHALNLMRYDLKTDKTTTMLNLGNATDSPTQVKLSPDKHWLLIVNNSLMNQTSLLTRLQLLRTDGTQMQTLACFLGGNVVSASWLPDRRQVAVTRDQYDQQRGVYVNTVDVLDLTSGKMRTVLSGDYSPSTWLDDHRLIVETSIRNTTNYYLFDTNNGSQQKVTNLPHIASLTIPDSPTEGHIAVSSDRSLVFISSFAQRDTHTPGCQGTAAQGPGTLKAYMINGGSTHTIYSDQNHAIMIIQPVDAHTLLIYIENNVGDVSQNGLWKLKSDGTGLTRLMSANDPRCRDTGYWAWAPQIAHNDQSYALLQTDFNHNENQSIVVGNLSGGTPTTIATSTNVALPRGKADFERFLQLVGMI